MYWLALYAVDLQIMDNEGIYNWFRYLEIESLDNFGEILIYILFWSRKP
jgi:hypothetical protein